MTPSRSKRRSPFEDVGRTVDRALADFDKEAERLIDYINDEVVPAVRKHSSKAMRTAARELERFADYMDKQRRSS